MAVMCAGSALNEHKGGEGGVAFVPSMSMTTSPSPSSPICLQDCFVQVVASSILMAQNR